MKYVWADGFHRPKNVDADTVKAALDVLPEPSPENLLDATKAEGHVLHEDLWAEGDQVWAQRGRLDRCRRIIGAVHEIVPVGNREVSIRAVEFVRPNGEGRWASLDNIRNDPDLLDAYLGEVERLAEQAAAKSRKVRELLRQRGQD